jgi:hypothetical protein
VKTRVSARRSGEFDVAFLSSKRDNKVRATSEQPMTLREMTIAALQNRGEPMTYRDLTDLLWFLFPELKARHFSLYEEESKARKEIRIQLGGLVKKFPQTFAATMSEGRVLVGLAVSEESNIEDEELEEELEQEANEGPLKRGIYWYTYPAYQAFSGPYPIKIGQGLDPNARIRGQVTAMPEKPVILGTYPYKDPVKLENALHSVLILRGRHKTDAPGTEWFMTTPREIESLLVMVLGDEFGGQIVE